jgi:DNA helicase-4
MFTRLRQRFQRKVETVQYQAIQLVSVRRTYKERRDKNKLRELGEIRKEFNLSESQVIAATSHAKETLVVAGAGSGKTSVLVGRAKYLVEFNRAKPEQILMLAYNKDAADELSERTLAAGIGVQAKTFHGFGNSVLKEPGERTGVAFGGKGEVAGFLSKQLSEALSESDRELLSKYFAEQLVPLREYGQFKNLSEYAAYVQATIPRTLMDERVKSHGEWLIANRLFSLGIDYAYERLYDVSGTPRERHQPDFTVLLPEDKQIYVEYFGIDRNKGTAPGISREAYLEGIEWKMGVHEENRTILISLYYYDLLEGNLVRKLDEALKEHEVEFKPRSYDEILKQANEIGYYSRFLKVCEQFLGHVRAQRLSIGALLGLASRDERGIAFLSVFSPLLSSYEKELDRQKLPDFAELIHGAADKIEQGLFPIEITHLMVDEFQDISKDRNRLIEVLKFAKPDLEVTCVGDDWQSIYRFSGSDISIMRSASKPKMNRKRVDLGETYRLPQELADLSRSFILKNSLQLEKIVVSKTDPGVQGRVVTHWDTEQKEIKENLRKVIERIGADGEDPSVSLRVLARYSDNLPDKKFVESLWEGPVAVSSIHAAKGLEADYVIVTDLMQDFRGFPSTIEDDPVMRLVMPEQDLHLHGEERRLFYVAITRARRECHLISPISAPSLFTLELLEGGMGEHVGIDESQNRKCPMCLSGRILTSLKSSGSYCSNIPLCDFRSPLCPECNKSMTVNDSGHLRYICGEHPDVRLRSCPACTWGALVPRKRFKQTRQTEDVFYGCHTWSKTRCKGKLPRS